MARRGGPVLPGPLSKFRAVQSNQMGNTLAHARSAGEQWTGQFGPKKRTVVGLDDVVLDGVNADDIEAHARPEE